jgi:hypothetical protein
VPVQVPPVVVEEVKIQRRKSVVFLEQNDNLDGWVMPDA